MATFEVYGNFIHSVLHVRKKSSTMPQRVQAPFYMQELAELSGDASLLEYLDDKYGSDLDPGWFQLDAEILIELNIDLTELEARSVMSKTLEKYDFGRVLGNEDCTDNAGKEYWDFSIGLGKEIHAVGEEYWDFPTVLGCPIGSVLFYQGTNYRLSLMNAIDGDEFLLWVPLGSTN